MSADLAVAAAPLRILPVPEAEPQAVTALQRPALLSQVHPAQCVLPLAPGPPAHRPRIPAPGRPASAPGASRAFTAHPDDDGPRATPAAQLPDPAPMVTAVVCASIEVLAGARPAAQMLRWLTSDAYAGLQRQAAAAARARRGSNAPVRRAAVRRVVTTAPRDGALEAAVVVQEGRRVRAVALRLEGWDGRWRVTALEVG